MPPVERTVRRKIPRIAIALRVKPINEDSTDIDRNRAHQHAASTLFPNRQRSLTNQTISRNDIRDRNRAHRQEANSISKSPAKPHESNHLAQRQTRSRPTPSASGKLYIQIASEALRTNITLRITNNPRKHDEHWSKTTPYDHHFANNLIVFSYSPNVRAEPPAEAGSVSPD